VQIFDLKNEDVSIDLRLSDDQNEKCKVLRHQSTENWVNASQENGSGSLDDLRIGVSCPDTFKILTSSKKVEFQTKSLNLHKNGGLNSLFRNGIESASYIV